MSFQRATDAASEAQAYEGSDESSSAEMEVHARRLRAVRPSSLSRRPRDAGGRRLLSRERVGMLLGGWQQQEVSLACRFAECKALSREQVEDIYQQCTVELLGRRFESDEHLRNVLRAAIRNQALRLIRDERRRGEILRENTGQLQGQAREATLPEQAAVSREDRMLVGEFLSELTPLERRIFWLSCEGKGYRAIASSLSIDERLARNATRSCERKRQTFQSLFETGRLCGYRSETIRALQAGEQTSRQLAASALLHFSHCGHCRAEHKLSAGWLRERFNGQVAALLPPILGAHLGWATRAALRARTLTSRIGASALAGGGLRERAAAVLAGGGTAAKLAAGAASVAVIGGGAIGITGALTPTHHRPSRRSPAAQSAAALSRLASPAPWWRLDVGHGTAAGAHRAVHAASSHPARRTTPGHVVGTPSRRQAGSEAEEGFAYLGVPEAQKPPAPEGGESEGGPFSP